MDQSGKTILRLRVENKELREMVEDKNVMAMDLDYTGRMDKLDELMALSMAQQAGLVRGAVRPRVFERANSILEELYPAEREVDYSQPRATREGHTIIGSSNEGRVS